MKYGSLTRPYTLKRVFEQDPICSITDFVQGTVLLYILISADDQFKNAITLKLPVCLCVCVYARSYVNMAPLFFGFKPS